MIEKFFGFMIKKGGNGKTYLAKYLHVNKKAFYATNGKSADIIYAFDESIYDIIVFDFTRDYENYINYSILEQFKNGLLFSPKFNSTVKITTGKKVVVFSNFIPDVSKLSEDRWSIVELDEEGNSHVRTYSEIKNLYSENEVKGHKTKHNWSD